MRALFFSILGWFLTPLGVVLMGVLDASLVFFLPLGIDFVVIVMTARKPELFWLYAVLATVGSVGGGLATFWIGRKVGEVGLTRFVNARRLERAKARVGRGAFVVAALGVIPPPFPFTPFVLTGGALELNPWPFFGTLAAARALRFGVEAGLASHYGAQIIRWMRTPTFEAVIGLLIALAVIGTIASVIAVARGTRSTRSDSGAAPPRRRTASAASRPR
jgi:membrane protein YqaA with SNARE-associated domain